MLVKGICRFILLLVNAQRPKLEKGRGAWVAGRKVPLEVYGPCGMKAITKHVLAARADDIKIRNEVLDSDHRHLGRYQSE